MLLPSTMTPIATSTLTTATASITFSSLPQNYTDIICVVSYNASSSTALNNIRFRFNTDASSNYSATGMENGLSYRYTNQTGMELGYQPAVRQSNLIAQIQNYSNPNVFKSAISRANNPNAITQSYVGLWRNTNAISSIEIFCAASTFGINSIFTLYGVRAA